MGLSMLLTARLIVSVLSSRVIGVNQRLGFSHKTKYSPHSTQHGTINVIDSASFCVCVIQLRCGRGSRVVWVSARGLLCHGFEPSTIKEPPCRAEMHVKSVES
ncbi:hypothetical protein TNCV_2355531 [Trichonephila clavipes]|nr:hypothetical protein TNCV_2355531 [Trichonephila clavipes]